MLSSGIVCTQYTHMYIKPNKIFAALSILVVVVVVVVVFVVVSGTCSYLFQQSLNTFN